MIKKVLFGHHEEVATGTSAKDHESPKVHEARRDTLVTLLSFALHENKGLDTVLSCEANLQQGLLDSSFNRVYSSVPRNYGDRGGFPYFKPCQWVRYGVRVEDFHAKYRGWQVCYHGTRIETATAILLTGMCASQCQAAQSLTASTICLARASDGFRMCKCLCVCVCVLTQV